MVEIEKTNIAEAEGNEYEPFPELVIPEAVASPVREANDAILEKCFTVDRKVSQMAPATILVLERSAVLPALSTELMFSQHFGLSEKAEFITVPVGKVLAMMFAEEMGLDEEDVDLESQGEEFAAWLKRSQDPTVVSLLEKVETLKNRENWPILVLDDAEASGETIGHTLPAVLKAAAGINAPFEYKTFFDPNLRWEKVIIDELKLNLSDPERIVLENILKGGIDARRLKIEMDSGFYDFVGEGFAESAKLVEMSLAQGKAIIPFDNEVAVRLAGWQALFSTNALGEALDDEALSQATNPGQSLLNRFGLEALLRFHLQAKQQYAVLWN